MREILNLRSVALLATAAKQEVGDDETHTTKQQTPPRQRTPRPTGHPTAAKSRSSSNFETSSWQQVHRESLAAEPKLHTWRKNQRTKPVPRRRTPVSGLSAQGPFRLKTNMAKQLPPFSVLSQEADGKRNKTHKAQALRQAGYAVGTVPLVIANVRGAKPSAINRAATQVCSVFKMFMERSLDATSAQREHPCTEVWCILARVTHTDSPHLGQTPRH